MESLSRPFHSRKLSNATTFTPRNSYDGVFSGHRHNYAGASPIDVQDYREIFANSPAASSIPVLDLSTLREPSSDALNLNLNFRSSEPDYSKIFGCFRDEDVAVSYEELFARDKPRAPSSKTSSSPDSDNLSHHSADALKQFNMSYNKISQKNKDGLDHGTRHVTQLHAIPGFTRSIDEAVPPLMEAKKHDSAAVHVSLDSIKISKHHPGDLKVHPSTVSSPSSSPTNTVDHKDYPKRSTAMNSESRKTDTSESGLGTFSPAYFDAEVDANSAASASAASLKKAIEKAQESIRIAKESVGRKKKGLRSVSSKSFKDSLKVEGEEPKSKDEVRGVFQRNTASVSSHVVGRNRKYGDMVVFPDFMDSEKLSVAKRVIDEIHGKFSESTKECLILKDNTIVSTSTQVEVDISRESKENRPNYAHELVTESNDLTVSQKVEKDEKKVPLESVLSDNEKQEEVLEQEQIKNAEKSDDEASDKGLETKESVQTCGDNIQESEEICHNRLQEDDFEKKQEDNHTGDRKVEEMETHKSYKVDMNDNNVETTEEVDDEFQVEDTEAMKGRKDEIIDKTSIDETSCDDNEDEYEVKSESESREEEESQVSHKEKPEIETRNETKDDEVAAREREREKERLAVERAIREARERARERAERAAVEKATEEIRHRMSQSKLRAERAAVERATSEARQRALEKAMTKKPLQQDSQSALRSKAKLEKDNRIMERAAKALAEKEKRDLLAQKEQAERNRLAENLDADIKRWSNGKEGNLRALLSTLQYILGAESGWQPIPLTEIIARSAVKKAYRKATLCVHPDKLQQRGATIQHKYICEKVFDLLKAAWNKFNSEER